MPEIIEQRIDIMDHDCPEPECSLLRLVLHGSTLVEVDGQLLPCVTLSPEGCFDLISTLSQALKGKIVMMDEED